MLHRNSKWFWFYNDKNKWKCDKCSFEYRNKKFCVKCNIDKNGKSVIKNHEDSNDWICSFCKFRISGDKKYCDKCDINDFNKDGNKDRNIESISSDKDFKTNENNEVNIDINSKLEILKINSI